MELDPLLGDICRIVTKKIVDTGIDSYIREEMNMIN